MLVLPGDFHITSQQADCVILICFFLIANLLVELHFHHEAVDERKKDSKLKELNPFHFSELTAAEKSRKTRLQNEILETEMGTHFSLFKNETWVKRLSSGHSDQCECHGKDSVKITDFVKNTNKIGNFVREKVKHPPILFGGSGDGKHVPWKYPGGGIYTQPGVWVNVNGVMITVAQKVVLFGGEKGGEKVVNRYKAEIHTESGFLEFSKNPLMQEHEFDDDDFFMVKKIDEADDGGTGFKYVTIRSKSLTLINQQLQFLVYRYPESDKLSRVSKDTDYISFSLNENDRQTVKVPIWVEAAKVPHLNLMTRLDSSLSEIITIVFVIHEKTSNPDEKELSELQSTRYGKLPMIIVNTHTEASPLEQTTQQNIKLYQTKVFPHKLGLSQVETEYVLYSDYKYAKEILKSQVIENGLRYLTEFGVDIISGGNEPIGLREENSKIGACHSKFPLNKELTKLGHDCFRSQVGDDRMFLGSSLEARKIVLGTRSHHAVEFWEVGKQMGTRVAVCPMMGEFLGKKDVVRERYSNYVQSNNLFCMDV